MTSRTRIARLSAAPAALAAAASLFACVPRPPPTALPVTPVQYDALPGWSADTLVRVFPALLAECRRLARLPADTQLGGQASGFSYGIRAADWGDACAAQTRVAQGDDRAIRRSLEAWFQPYRVTAPALFTGYYEPEVAGALSQRPGYETKLLARPDDLLQGAAPASDPNGQPSIGRLANGRIVPYWTRREIEDGAASKTARTLFWLRSPIDLFFLQVQGAGRVRLPDGSVVRLAFDGKNGRPYTPIGRVLEARHAIAADHITMQSIRAWLLAHPAEAKAVMDSNDDYVFFRIVTDADIQPDEGDGPPGALGIHLTAGRSAAIDRHFVPLGALLFVDTTDPLTNTAWRRLVLAQDRGSDINGAGRTDLFIGAGDTASAQAGAMRQPGTEYILLPRPPANHTAPAPQANPPPEANPQPQANPAPQAPPPRPVPPA